MSEQTETKTWKQTLGAFLNDDKNLSAPPITSLGELQSACEKYEDESEDASDRDKWINMLITPGSSLGGARPKANVRAKDGSLWIAKFPSQKDDGDIEAWEMVLNDLAKTLALNVPEVELKKIKGRRHTFLSKRFDREKDKRIHFASAMTLLGYEDGDSAATGASYLELAEFITRFGRPRDLRELWTRIVFNICVGNSDDHLRNHGFIFRERVWELSPAYDLTPNPDAQGLSLNIDETSNALDLDIALSVAKNFGVSQRDAKETIRDFSETIDERWSVYADDYKISRAGKDRFASAFDASRPF